MRAAAGTVLAVLLFAAGCGGPPRDGVTPAAVAPRIAPGAETETRGASRDAGGAAVPPLASTGAPGDRNADRTQVRAPAPRPSRATREGLQQLDAGGVDAFERFVAGPWYRLPEPEAGSPGGPVQIIHFEPAARRVTLFDGEVQEVYDWDNSERLRSRQFDISMHNALVASIGKTMSIEALADDEARLAMQGSDADDDQEGIYRRLGEAARHDLVRPSASQPGVARLDIAGIYRGSDDEWIRFDPPRFTWQQNGRLLSGGFAVYSVDQLVIVFKVLATGGTTRAVRTYTLDYREQQGDDRVRRSLVLRPARLEISGVTSVGATALHFEQVELIDVAALERSKPRRTSAGAVMAADTMPRRDD